MQLFQELAPADRLISHVEQTQMVADCLGASSIVSSSHLYRSLNSCNNAEALDARYRAEAKPDLYPCEHAAWLVRTRCTLRAAGSTGLHLHKRDVQG